MSNLGSGVSGQNTKSIGMLDPNERATSRIIYIVWRKVCGDLLREIGGWLIVSVSNERDEWVYWVSTRYFLIHAAKLQMTSTGNAKGFYDG